MVVEGSRGGSGAVPPGLLFSKYGSGRRSEYGKHMYCVCIQQQVVFATTLMPLAKKQSTYLPLCR